MAKEELILAKTDSTSIKAKTRKSFNIISMLPIASLIILITIFSIGNPYFLSFQNFFNILRQSSILLIVSSGVTFIILMGSIDLSFGSVVTLSGAVTALSIVQLGLGIFPGVILGAVAGLLCGLVNGLIFSYIKVPSFLVTLGTMFALNGISLIVLNGSPVPVNNPIFLSLARGTPIAGIPNIALWALVVYGVTIFIAFRTRFGRYMFAIGGGELVAKMSGVPVSKFKVYGFLVTGLLAGLAGSLMVARIGAATPNMGEGLLLEGIAAVVIGGTSLTGGVGGPQKTLLGVLIISILSNGMDIVSVDPYLQVVIKGIVVILAVAIGLDRSKIKITK